MSGEAGTGAERVILADCCEDWILEWGQFYDAGTSFECPECGTAWTKSARERYRRADAREFLRRERRRADGAFPYLAAADGREPVVDRCCARIILDHGDGMRDGAYACPVCGTTWTRRTERLHGLRVPSYMKDGLAEALAVRPGRTRAFLVGVSEWSPPRD